MKRSAEKGQAFMELIVCLIPLVFVFAGLILVAVLGKANVACTIQARSAADSAEGSISPKEISDWNIGKDGIPFTLDDQAAYSGFADRGTDFSTMKHTVQTDSDYFNGQNLSMTDLAESKYVSQMPGRVSFSSAASLTGTKVTMENVLGENGLSAFSRMFQLYLKSETTEIKDTVFIPHTTDAQYENFESEP